MKSLIIGSMILVVFTLFGCSSSDTSTDVSDTSTDITVIDGYIKGAVVTDNKGQIAVEKNASKGLYTFATTPAYPIRTTGGTIVDTNEMFDMDMVAYSGHIISPISTFIGNDENLTNNLKQSLGLLSKDDLLDDYIASDNLSLAKVSALFYAVLKDSSLKQAFQNRLKMSVSGDLFADAIEDAHNSPKEFSNYINDLVSFSVNIQDLETFLKNDKNNLVPPALPPEYPVNNILFAHGLQLMPGKDGKSDWDVWVNYLKEKGWNAYYCNDGHNASILESESDTSNKNVYRCTVAGTGSIETRATQLAQYINTLNVPDDSITAVGHSMGGLDLHYIVSKGHDEQGSIFYNAAKKIHKVYTIASPHKGNQFAGTVPISKATHDLGLEQMQQFNKDYPYTTFEIDNRKIDLMALRFECFNGADGVVSVQNQSLNGAPHSQQIYIGKHMSGMPTSECSDINREQNQGEAILNDIIIKSIDIPSETHDIVFYEGNDCTEGEKGVFSSFHEIEADCKTLGNHNDNCDNDEIRSVKIFPGVKKNTIISVYDDKNYDEDDDWAVINTGSKDLTKSVCVNSFEDSLSDEAKDAGITKFYHKGSMSIDGGFLDGKISSIKVKHSFESKGKVLFYEGNSCEQEVKGRYNTADATIVSENCMHSGSSCDNDEIQSVLIFPSVADNTVIKLYDDPEGTESDDWFYIDRGDHTLDVPYCINGLEKNSADDDTAKEKGIYFNHYPNNGLNGKVSHVTIMNSKGNELVFLDADKCSGNIVLSLDGTRGYDGDSGDMNFKNDEIRSMLIFPSVPNNTIIKLYDEPNGSLNDDSIYIYRGDHTLNSPVCISNLEHDTSSEEDEKGIHTYYRNHNGLNGKVSRIRVTTNKSDEIAFFEGNACTQDVKGDYYSSYGNIDVNCKNSDKCDNDEIKSVLIFPGVAKNTVVKLYDDKDGSEDDDWFYIDRGDHTLDVPYCIHNLESNQETDSRGIYFNHYPHNGLDGKVSHMTITK